MRKRKTNYNEVKQRTNSAFTPSVLRRHDHKLHRTECARAHKHTVGQVLSRGLNVAVCLATQFSNGFKIFSDKD
jgi:hypothetical protein